MSEYDDLIEDEPAAPSDLPKVMTASELIQEPESDEVPPMPGEAGDLGPLTDLPLAAREAAKLARMTPEQKARYDQANSEIMSHPAVKAFAAEEERRKVDKAAIQAAFIKAHREKKK